MNIKPTALSCLFLVQMKVQYQNPVELGNFLMKEITYCG